MAATKPTTAALIEGTLADLLRSKPELLAENALLRQQLAILNKYGQAFTRVVESSGIGLLRTAYRAPRQNATCERFLGSVRREGLDHLLILGERHLRRILEEYVLYCNRARPHQGLGQRCPHPWSAPAVGERGRVVAIPVLVGLHHDYQRAA